MYNTGVMMAVKCILFGVALVDYWGTPLVLKMFPGSVGFDRNNWKLRTKSDHRVNL